MIIVHVLKMMIIDMLKIMLDVSKIMIFKGCNESDNEKTTMSVPECVSLGWEDRLSHLCCSQSETYPAGQY